MSKNPGQFQDDAKADKFMEQLVPNQRRILSYIAALAPQKNDAEDIYQDVLTEMWKKFDQFTPGTDFDRWGITIAKFKILNFRRKAGRSKIIFSDEIIELIQNESDKQRKYIDECLDALQGCAKKLSPRQLKFLRMHYEDELSCRKIASNIGLTHQAICKVMSRIHAALVKCIKLTLREEGRYEC